MIALGLHVIADLYRCDPAVLDDEAAIRGHMLAAAERCGATIVTSCFHRFSPHGISGVVVIAESHLAIHSWPEHGFAAVDLFTCGDTLRPRICFEYLRAAFRSERHVVRTLPRGEPPLHDAQGT